MSRGRHYLLDGGGAEDDELEVDPFSLLLGEQVAAPDFVVLRVEGGDDNADEKVDEEEVTYYHEHYEEQGPEDASLLLKDIVNLSRRYTVHEHILPSSRR